MAAAPVFIDNELVLLSFLFEEILDGSKLPSSSTIIVPNITDLTYHVRIWESTFLQRKDSSSGQESYLSQFL